VPLAVVGDDGRDPEARGEGGAKAKDVPSPPSRWCIAIRARHRRCTSSRRRWDDNMVE
jgi:hypothetical protein